MKFIIGCIVVLVLVLLGWYSGYVSCANKLARVHTEQLRLERLKLVDVVVNLKDGYELKIASLVSAVTELHDTITELQDTNEVKTIKTNRGDLERKQIFTITAYSPYDNQNGIQCGVVPGCTFTSTKPKPGTMSVDPTVIPYGSAILIVYDDGTIELGKAEDCGSAIKGNHIDVFRDTYREAVKFGSKKAVVIWYKEDRIK